MNVGQIRQSLKASSNRLIDSEDEENEAEPLNNLQDYYSSNLISRNNMTLADIQIDKLKLDSVSTQEIYQQFQRGIKNTQWIFIDPKIEYVEKQKYGQIETLVDYDNIKDLTFQASELYDKFIKQQLPIGTSQNSTEIINNNSILQEHNQYFRLNIEEGKNVY